MSCSRDHRGTCSDSCHRSASVHCCNGFVGARPYDLSVFNCKRQYFSRQDYHIPLIYIEGIRCQCYRSDSIRIDSRVVIDLECLCNFVSCIVRSKYRHISFSVCDSFRRVYGSLICSAVRSRLGVCHTAVKREDCDICKILIIRSGYASEQQVK